jgi:UDP-glucose 4-epimerase
MLYRAYRYYHENRREIESRKNVSAHRQAARMGIISLLKMIS